MFWYLVFAYGCYKAYVTYQSMKEYKAPLKQLPEGFQAKYGDLLIQKKRE